ncbi:unnamed protein product [Prunus brigantina]
MGFRDLHEFNLALITKQFAEAISKIKFASPRNKDRLVWPFEKNGF